MRQWPLVATVGILASLFGSCAAPGPSPSATYYENPIAPSAAPALTTPPFTVAFDGAQTVHPGRWPALVIVETPRGVIQTERPETLRLTCAGTTTMSRAGFGLLPIICEFPTVGAFRVEAVVHGDGGFTASSTTMITVTQTPADTVPVYYSVIETSLAGADVVFSTRTLEKATRYIWDFGDGGIDRTMLPQVQHRFTQPATGTNERLVTVLAHDRDGVTLATGSVVGRW